MEGNKLEAMVLPVTSKEIDNRSFERFIRQLTSIPVTELVFVVMINNINHTTDIKPMIEQIRHKFASVEIVYANISSEDDVYIPGNPGGKMTPTYGFASGPNILFLSCMEYCKRFNTTLLVESDCYVKPSFLFELEMFTRYSGGFLIAGTTYDGCARLPDCSHPDFHHLNGVALYKTGDSLFGYVMEQLSKYIIEHVKETPFLAYDIALMRMIFNSMSTEQTNDWKRVYKQIVKTNLIVNLSPGIDAETADIPTRFPKCVILHKKFTDRDLHSLLGFQVPDLDK